MTTLFTPLPLGDLLLPNRVMMAPLTRMRSQQPGDIPHALNAAYYAQRASAGLIISEASQVCPQGKGYPATPGIHSLEQIEGWKLVTDAVHAAGGRIFLQLWHVGRISHSSFHEGQLPVAPSAIAAKGSAFTAEGKQVSFETPRALELGEIPGVVEAFRQGALNAKEAGFDGVEVHGANGYLPDQFLQDSTNHRTDAYGGSIENRAKLLLEIVDAVTEVWGSSRVGVRLAPYGAANDMSDSDPVSLFSYVLKQLSQRHVVYAHLVEARAAGGNDVPNPTAPDVAGIFRSSFDGVLFSAGGYNRELAIKVLEEGKADAIVFGRHFIANPDLPERLLNNAPLNAYDRKTFYGGGAKGYTDYPYLGS